MIISDARKAELRAKLKDITVTKEPDWRGSMTACIDQTIERLTERLAGYSVRRHVRNGSPFDASATEEQSIRDLLSQAFTLRAALPKTDLFTALGAFGQIERACQYFETPAVSAAVDVDPVALQIARDTLAKGRK